MNKKKKKMIDYGRYGYFFIAPFFITYLVFQLWPLINTFYYSTLTYYKRRRERLCTQLSEKYPCNVGLQLCSSDSGFPSSGCMADG